MITPEFCRIMARYNAWQNRSLVNAADTLTEDARRADRGAFFGSIFGTLNHILWGDTMWMSRLAGWDKPTGSIGETPKYIADWAPYTVRRIKTDARIQAWADRLTLENLDGDLAWYSGAVDANVQKPLKLCVQHFFNHQTHHRGQVHAMLTAAGTKPDDTDIVFMPEEG